MIYCLNGPFSFTPKSSISKIPKVKRYKKQRRGERNLSKTFSRSDESSAWKILKEEAAALRKKNQSNLMISFTLFKDKKKTMMMQKYKTKNVSIIGLRPTVFSYWKHVSCLNAIIT